MHKVLFMPSKSLFPQSCVSSGMSIVWLMLTSSKRTYAIPTSAAPRTLTLWQATAALCLCRRHKHSSGSVSVGDSGFWCTQDFVCAIQESVSPFLCKFWWLYGGVNCNLLKEGFCYTQVCSTQGPCPCSRPLLTHTSTGDTQTLKGRSGSGSVESPGMHKVLSEPSEHLWPVWGLIVNAISPLLPSCCGFALGHGVYFFGGIQHSPVDGCSAASCNFGVLAGEDEHTSFYSARQLKMENTHFSWCTGLVFLQSQ